MARASFTIPLPPSLNNIFFNKPHGGRGKTTEYKNWLDATAWEIKAQRPGFIPGDVRISMIIERPNAASDLDNRIKASLDAIVKAGVIEDDKRVAALMVVWGDVSGARIRIAPVRKAAA